MARLGTRASRLDFVGQAFIHQVNCVFDRIIQMLTAENRKTLRKASRKELPDEEHSCSWLGPSFAREGRDRLPTVESSPSMAMLDRVSSHDLTTTRDVFSFVHLCSFTGHGEIDAVQRDLGD